MASSALFYYLSLARLVTGASAWMLPNETSDVFGLKRPSHSDAVLMTRLFGCRDFVLGGSLLYSRGNKEAFKLALQMGLVCDTIDIVAGLISYKNGTGVKATLLASAGAAVFALIAAHLLSSEYQ